jgi:hypothetical protein
VPVLCQGKAEAMKDGEISYSWHPAQLLQKGVETGVLYPGSTILAPCKKNNKLAPEQKNL